MKKIRKIFLTLITLIMLIVCSLFLINYFSKGDSLDFIDNTNKVCAYDYILAEMNKPEYYGVERMYDYFTEEEVQERLPYMPNGSGWYLSDAKTASFSRGYEDTITYNFSNFTVTLGGNWSTYKVVYDYKNNNIYSYNADDPETIYYSEATLIKPLDTSKDILFQCGDLYEYRGAIKNSMLNYAYLFELAGCPILMQPEGTLESYKELMVNPVDEYQKINMNCGDYYEAREEMKRDNNNKYADSTKIDFPWELENYYYDLRKNPTLQWIDDYTKVPELINELPSYIKDYGMATADPNPETAVYYHNIQDYTYGVIVFVNRELYDYVKEKDSAGIFLLNTLNGNMLPNITSNLVTYYHRPILEKIYGKDVVYYCDMNQLKNKVLVGKDTEISNIIPEEDFDKFGFIHGEDSFDSCVLVYKTGYTIPSVNNQFYTVKYEIHSLEDSFVLDEMLESKDEVGDLLSFTDNEQIFSDVYLTNLNITIDNSYRLFFGLK